MGLPIANIVFDCDNVALVADFWAAVTGYEKVQSFDHFAALKSPIEGSPSILFLKVPEPKTVKNRVHIDLYTVNFEEEIARLTALGAKPVHTIKEHSLTWITMLDPEGNEFDLAHHS